MIKEFILYWEIRIKNSPLWLRLATGAFWSFAGTFIAKVIVLIAGIICAHFLTKEQYGEFGLVRSTINTFVVAGMAGLGVTATKYISEFRKSSPKRIIGVYLLTNSFTFITATAVTIFVWLLAPYISSNILHAEHLETAIKIGSLLLFVATINSAQNGTLSGFEDFKSIAFNTLYGNIAESILMLFGAYYYGVNGAILGYGCGFVVLYILNFRSIKKRFLIEAIQLNRNTIRLCKEDFELIYKFSLPAALSSLLVAPTFWIVRTILESKDGFGALATFEAADQWKTIILFIPSALSQVILPILSSLNDEKRNFLKVFRVNLFLNVGVATTIAIIIIVISPFIMRLYGDGYTDHSCLSYLAASTVFTAASSVIGISISSRSKMWHGFVFNFVWAMLTIVFSYFFVNHLEMGPQGVGLAILLSYIIHTIIQSIYLRCTIKSVYR